jgi:23S rRNA (uracil1939-C5)-methyltransferase
MPLAVHGLPQSNSGKKQRVEQALIALLGAECAVPAVEELAAPNEWHYRNRAQFKSDGERLGYLAARSRSIVDITECPVLTASNQSQLARLRNKLPNPEWRPSRSREWTTLDIDDQRSDAIINQRQPFRQGNTEQNTVMKDWLRSQLGTDTRPLKVLELFAGSGNFTQVLVDPERTVVAVEVAETALQAMSEAGLPNVVVECCDLFDNTAAEALATRHADTRWLVLDPPRDGFTTRESVIPRLIELERVLYISCDLATWQRDARYFLDEGFSVDEVSLIDLFPQTPHVEILSTFSRL